MSGAVNIKPLSKQEERKLKELEAVIDTHQRGFYAVGMALAEIQAEKLYRLQADTFEVYANEVWGMAERTVYRYINAALVYENLRHGAGNEASENLTHGSGFKQEDLPANERQCRPLTSIAPEEQPEIWLLVIQTAEKEDIRITAALVSRCVYEYKGEKFRNKLQEAKEKLSGGTVKEHGTNISPKMDLSFRTMLSTIEEEMASRWRHTSKEVVQNLLENLLTAVRDL
jgi:hypothetical protein